MIGIPTRRKSFLAWDRDLVIDVAGFYLSMLGLYFDGFGIIELLEWVLQGEVVVSGEVLY